MLLISDLFPPTIGGIQQHVRSLANNLMKRGHEVLVFTSNSIETTCENHLGVKVVRTPHSLSYFSFLYKERELLMHFIPPIPDIVWIKSLRRTIGSFQPDVIHVHGWSMFTAAAIKYIYPQLPLVSTLHDHGFFCSTRICFNEMSKGKCFKNKPDFGCILCARKFYGFVKALTLTTSILIFQGILKKIDRVIVPSKYMADRAQKAGFSKVIMIPNFIDLDESEKDIVESSLNEQMPSFDLLYVGTLTPYKGINVLLEAYEFVEKKYGYHLCLGLIGNKEPGYMLTTSSPRIRIIQNLPHKFLLPFIQNAKIFVIPSILQDNAPTVALEAMMVKKPVIASKVGGLPEIVSDQRTGLLVAPNDYLELANAILFLLERPETAKEMGLNGYKRLVEKFSAKGTVPRIENVYKELIK